MANTETHAVDSLDGYNGPFIVVMAPDYRCCECGQPLRPRLCGLRTVVLPMPFPCVFLVCGTACQRAGLPKLSGGVRQVHLLSAAEARLLMDCEDLIAGYAQISRCGPAAIMEPFKMKDELTHNALLSHIRRWTN